MIVPDAWRWNSYRVLRASAEATRQEIQKTTAAIKRAAALGVVLASSDDVPQLGKRPGSEADIRTAQGRLANPMQRLADRLLWFSSAGAIPGPVAGHDSALKVLYSLLDVDLDEAAASAWIGGLRRWHGATDDTYWAHFIEVETEGGFEPLARNTEVEEVRRNAMRSAAEPIVLTARSAIGEQQFERVAVTLGILDQLADTGAWASTARDEIQLDLVVSLRHLCSAVRDECSSRTTRKQDVADVNRPVCESALRRFRTEIEPALGGTLRVLPPNHPLALVVREEAAQCLSGIASDYTWADEFTQSLQLQEEALALAAGTLAAIRIESQLSDVRQTVRAGRLSEFRYLLIAINDQCRSRVRREDGAAAHNRSVCAETLIRFRNEVQPLVAGANSTLADDALTHELARGEAALFLSSIGIDYTWADDITTATQLQVESLAMAKGLGDEATIAERLREARKAERQYQVFGSLKPISSAPTLRTINGIGLTVYGQHDFDPETRSYVTVHYFVLVFVPIFPIARYRVIAVDDGRYQFLGKLPLRAFDRWHIGVALMILVVLLLFSNSAGGATSGSELSDLKTQIETSQRAMSALERELKPVIDQLTLLDSQVQALAAEIKALDQEQKFGVSIDSASYNAKVEQHNQLLEERQRIVSQNRDAIERYKAMSKQDSDLVDRYNALVNRK